MNTLSFLIYVQFFVDLFRILLTYLIGFSIAGPA
jgi:hypothetical protein